MTEYNKLINDVNNGKLSPIYLIHGEENYFINNIIKVSTDIIFSFIQTGIERTMNFYNKKNFIDENL